MSKLTTATQKKLTALAEEARGYLQELDQIGRSVEDRLNMALDRAWRLGKTLNASKRALPHGHWLIWLEANIPISRSYAYRHMELATANPHATSVEDLSVESVRKFRLQYVPDKPAAELLEDKPLPRSSHHLTVLNDWRKWRRQVEIGKAQLNVEEARRDLLPLYEWMREELYAEQG